MKKVVGQLVLLTKSIWLEKPTVERGFKSQFFPGGHNALPFIGGIAVCWWYTKRAFKSVENIASMIVESVSGFENCDLETVERTVKDTLQEVCVDKGIFNPDAVSFSRKGTLFDCRKIQNAAEFGSVILHAVLDRLALQITGRCTVYVAPRFKGPTFSLPTQGITALKRDDESAWRAIEDKGYSTDGWNPMTGKYRRGDDTFFSGLKYDYVFVCEEQGTQAGTRFSSSLKLRRFFAVAFAVTSDRRSHGLMKSAADPYHTCIQFSSPNSREGSITTSGIGELLPYYIDDHVLEEAHVAAVQSWFAALSSLPREKANRIEKGAHFVNRAMNANDIEGYVNYFVALDALFGERGSVESSILSGVQNLGLPSTLEEKVSWLFDLRNELVHGGSRYVKEWPKYDRYYRHFDTRPEHDVERLAFAALLRVPDVFSGS